MVDIYNAEDKAGKEQAINARLAHLGDRKLDLKKELYEIELEETRLKQERDFSDQSGD